MIEAIDLTVRRRGRTVLDAVNFDVRPGQVTGVLGGPGAGKTMLLRRMVELERGEGETLFNGRPFHALRHPMREVGLLLGASPGDPDRTVRGHLRLILATDRGAARKVAPTDIRGWSAGTTTAGRNAPRDGIAVVGSRRPSADWGEANRVYAAARTAATGSRVVSATSPGLGGGGSCCLDGQGGDARSGAGPAGLDLTAFGDLNTVDECSSERDGREGGGGGSRGDRKTDRRRHRDRRRGGAPNRGRAERRDSDVAAQIEATRRGRPVDRIDAVLDLVGLGGHGRTRLSELTEGMATRLGIAAALLGDPRALLLDCPDRGLEPAGVAWLGALLRAFTARGRAALVTGADTDTLVGMADRVLLLDSGYLVGTRTAEEVLRAPAGASVVVRSPQVVRLASILAEAGARSSQGEGACLEVHGLDRARVGDLAFRHGIPIHELSERVTGSDPADLVLAACSARRAGAVVATRDLTGGERPADALVPVAAPSRSSAREAGTAGTAGLLVPSAMRPSGVEPTGTVRLLAEPPGSAAQAVQRAQPAPPTSAAQVAPAAQLASESRSSRGAARGESEAAGFVTVPPSASVPMPSGASAWSTNGTASAGTRAETNVDSRAEPATDLAVESSKRRRRWRAAGRSSGRTTFYPSATPADLDEGVLAVWAAPAGPSGESSPVIGRDCAGESASSATDAREPRR